MSNNFCLVLSSFFLVACAMVTIYVSSFTDNWETITYDTNVFITNNATAYIAEVYEEYTKITFSTGASSYNGTVNYFYPQHGGIWKLCDSLSDTAITEIWRNSSHTRCLQLTDQDSANVSSEVEWLMRMQNSSASSIITALIVMVAAVVTGVLGIVCRQVSCVTVTGIMYAIAAVFICLALAVYHEKLKNENPPSCSDITQTITADVCNARQVTHSWSIVLAWISFTLNLLASGWWLNLSRVMRMEIMKSVNM